MKNFSKIVDNFDVTTKKYVDDGLAEKANSADLATVATSGSYNDLSNKPTIPDVSGLMPKSGGAFTGNISVPSTITFTNTTNPYIKMTTGGTAFYFQSTSGQFGLGPTWDKATHWNSNGNVTFPTTPKVGDISLALVSDIPSVPANYVTTDTAQTISGSKTFTAQPIINTSNGLKFTSGNCALRIYNTSASPTNYSAIEVRSNSSSTNRNLFIDLANNSLVVGQASGTADTTYKVNVKDSFNATTIYENGTPLSDKYCSDNSKHGYTELTNENLNTITEVGWYRAESGNSCTNKPFILPKPAFFLTVEKIGSGLITQTAYQAADSTSSYYQWYVRHSTDNGSSWSGWKNQQSIDSRATQGFSGLKVFEYIGVTNELQFGSDAGSNGQFAMSQGSSSAPKWVNLQVKVNGTTYTADNSGLIDLGEISGGGGESQYNDIY